MNFHKTIGFLAALLLTLGIGVPDSFAQATAETLSLTVSPRTLRDSTTANSSQVTVTARLTVTISEDAPSGGHGVPVVVAVSADATTGNLNTDNTSYEVTGAGNQTVTVPEGQTRFTDTVALTFTLSHDDDFADEEVTVTATIAATDATGDDDIVKTAKLTVTDHSASLARDAVSARGYQVYLTAPSATATARAVKDAIKVQLRRKRGLGKEFGAFTSIEIALRNRNAKGDADMPDADLYSLTITDAEDLGTLALSRVTSAEVTGTTAVNGTEGTTLNANNTKAYYTKGSDYDILEFRFHPTAGGDYSKLYALAVFNAATADTEIDLSLEDDLILSSLDDDISIYPASPSSFPGQMVGNGRTAKLDAGAPGNSIVSAVTIEIDDEVVATTEGAALADIRTAGATAGVGQKIKISASMADFGEHSLTFAILGRDARSFRNAADDADVEVTGALQVITGHTFKPISAIEVHRQVSQGKPVVVEVPVMANQFKRKANVAAHPTVKTIKKNGFYEDDDVIVVVRAIVKDRAGNAGNQTAVSLPFVLDSRPPKVTITYPKPSATDSTRFTAALAQEYSFLDGGGGSADLKPLNFKVDEGTTDVFVVIGADTLTIGGTPDAMLDEMAGGYDLTPDGGYALKNTTKPKNNKHPVEDSKQGGASVKLHVVAKDATGNTGVGMPDGGNPTFDAKAPAVEIVFPTNASLGSLDNKIGGDDRTQDPIFKVNEATDSILVRYVSSERTLDVAVLNAADRKVDENIVVQFMGDNALVDSEAYDLQVYVRDLAGQVGISDSDPDTDGAQPEEDLIFESGLMNPQASEFNIVTQVRKAATVEDDGTLTVNTAFANEDSVVAGQTVRLNITARDPMLSNKAAVAYRSDVTVVAMDSDGNKVSSASFSGTGVKDNGDGTASLAGTSWSVGKFNGVVLKATMAGDLTIAVKDDLDNPMVTGTADIHVDASNFAGFNISILENNVPVEDIRGAFQLRVEPTDAYGNVSVKSFKGAALADTLDLLDTRMPDATTLSYDGGIFVNFNTWPILAQVPPGIIPTVVPMTGRMFGIPDAPGGGAVELWVHVAVVNGNLNDDDMAGRDVNSSMTFAIKSALMPELTLWVPNVEGDQAGNDVTIPADADDVTVTVNAEGYDANSMVTFTKNGTMMDPVAANDEGTASLMITMSEAGDVTVSATDGRYETGDLTITFVAEPDEPVRMAFEDADGNAVYLIDLTDNTVDLGDYALFRAAWGMSASDDINGDGMADATDAQIFLQSDINDDGMVDLADYELFIMAWNKTAANGPASKPIVLLPGVNENAEFSLSLGSERVVAGEMVAVDVSLANVEALVSYGFTLNYDTDKFEFVSVAPANEDLLKSTGGETPMFFHRLITDGQVEVANGLVNGTAVSGGGDIVRFVFRVLYEFEDNARFEIANGLVIDPTSLSNPALVAGVLELQSTPREFALHQNFPNPFNPDTTIKYDLAESADITLQIYNVLGQVVRTLVASEAQNAGRYQIRWNGMDDRGVPVSSGVYFYQISAEGKFQQVQKLMLLK